MSCIVQDGSAIEKARSVAEMIGASLPPLIQQFCEGCNQWHAIETGEFGDMRYRRPPVDLPKKEKPDTWYERKYCHECHAYHNKDDRCGGVREAEDWSKKEWRP